MTISNSRLFKGFSILLATSLGLTLLSGCTGSGILSGNLFKERAAETPAPDEFATDKSFFVDSSGKAKTFLCAFAPEIGRGWFGELITPFVNKAAHCNVEFEITEHYLVAKKINPSFLDNSDRWIEWLKIPISKHYYYERNKDPHGRETNEWIENTSRSHWSARPKMKLDMAHVEISADGETSQDGSWGWKTTSVQDVEWDLANNFLGFSINANYHTTGGGDQPEEGVRFRINFLKFDHDPTFKKIPFNQENSRYMNVLHVMGRFLDGTEPDLYAAHWDVRKTTRIYITGAPKEQQPALIAAVYKWNHEFEKIGAVPMGQKAFVPVLKELDHPFDLRYPSITWIQDRRISLYAPLGIGMAHADVRNGKILWGGVVLFGGMIQNYINAYAPVENTPATTSNSLSPFGAMTALFPESMPAVKALDPARSFSRTQLMNNLTVDHKNFLTKEVATLGQSTKATDKAKADALRAQLQLLQSQDPGLNKVVADLNNAVTEQSGKVSEFFKHMGVHNLLGTASGVKTPGLSELAAKSGQLGISKALKETDLTKRQQMLKSIAPNSSPFFVESEMTIQNKVGGWMASPAQTTRTYPEILDSLVSSLIVHELGHFMGLGHQFKENIVPLKGTVPSHYVDELSAKATAEKEFSNMTSVMGYQSPRTEMMTPASEYVPGPQDDLVMRYLYKGEYAAYNDKQKDEFFYLPVPASGKIPEYTQISPNVTLRTSYFPNCNDYEASLGADPFCNRFDRGSNAVDIVNSYFEGISDNLLANMYSLVGGGGNVEAAENNLWYHALNSFSRVRLFYDEMRRRLRSDANLKPLWNALRNDKDALFEFSKACAQSDPTSDKLVQSDILKRIFADKGIVDLCRANSLALKEYAFFLNLPEADYTRIDHNNRYLHGGYLEGDAVRNAGHIFGSWYQMSNLPLKFTSLYTLASANAYMMWGPYLVSNPYYDNEENRYLYRTLYPTEFTRLISNTVQNNMRFAANGKDDTTTIGRAVLATGSLLPWQLLTSNDSARLPREFNDMLNQQTQFNFSMVAVLIEAVTPNAASNVKADHYKKFTASIYDFFTGKPSTARDVFLLPNGDIFVWANGMFIFPTTKIKFYNGTSAYVIAYKVDYDQGPRDDLVHDSLKTALMEKHLEIAGTCVNGFDSSGLMSYFDTANPQFEGFKILSGIAEETGQEKLGAFYDSLKEEFAKYEASQNKKIPASFPIKSMSRVCEEAIRGVGQISAAAAMANGYWLGITPDYLEK